MRPRASVILALVVLGIGAVAFAVVLITRRHGPTVHVLALGREVTVTSSRPTTAYLEYGPTAALGLFTASDPAGKIHRFRLTGLEPRTRYDVVAVTTLGTAATVVAGPRALPRRHTLRVAGGSFELDGLPWIPRLAWASCSSAYRVEAAIGIDAFMSSNCGDSPSRQAEEAARVHAVLVPSVDRAVASSPTTVATFVQDEPDIHGTSPAKLARRAHAFRAARGLLDFVTLSQRMLHGRGFARVADVLGTDVYPLLNTQDVANLSDVAAAQRKLETLAHGKPTYQWIEAVPPATAAETAAETWMAIANGARGVGYWTWSGTTAPFVVPAATRQTLREVNAALDTFAPPIDARSVPVQLSDPHVDAFATQLRGALYVFAVNTNPYASVRETFTVQGLAGRTVSVYDSALDPQAAGDAFTDSLPPLAWRIYLVPPR